MSLATYRKYGLFTALTMVIGSVVGIGIFIKNNSIFGITEGNGVATLLAWILGGIVSLFTALSFAEITKVGTNSNGGLSVYAKVYVSKRFSKFIKIVYPILYLSLLQVALGYYTYLFFLQAFSANGMEDATLVGAAITILAVVPLTTLLNKFVPKFSKNLLAVSLIVKFVPLLLAALIGLWVSNGGGGVKTDLPGWGTEGSSVGTMQGALIALPSVLFAFDAFIGVGTIAKDVKNPKKTIPLAVGGGMLFVAIIYTLITISQLQQNQGTVAGTIASVIGSEALSPLVNVIVVISAMGTYTALNVAGSSAMQDAIENDSIPFAGAILKKNGDRAGAIVNSLVSSIIALVLITLSLSFGNGKGDMIDAMSNMPTLFFFVVYAVIIIGYVKMQIQVGERGLRAVYLTIIATISSVSILLIVGYQFYSLIEGIVDNGFLPIIVDEETRIASYDWDAFVGNLSLILYPALLYLVPATIIFIKQRYEYKNKFKNSLVQALLLKFI